jgi:hypothetical protein
MPLVSPTQLTVLRNIAYKNLDSSALIERSTEVENDFGTNESWTIVATDVPCWIRGTTVPSSLSDVAMRIAVIGTFRIHFQVGTDIQLNDRLTIGGEQFYVIDMNVENTIQIFTTAMAKRVE